MGVLDSPMVDASRLSMGVLDSPSRLVLAFDGCPRLVPRSTGVPRLAHPKDPSVRPIRVSLNARPRKLRHASHSSPKLRAASHARACGARNSLRAISDKGKAIERWRRKVSGLKSLAGSMTA